MPKFKITWDAGNGPTSEIIEAKDQEEAEKVAYEAWLEEAEAQASFGAKRINASP